LAGRLRPTQKGGYAVSIIQNPTLSLADDVAVTKRTLATQNGSVILFGHSYGAPWSRKLERIRRSRARLHYSVRSRQGRIRVCGDQEPSTRSAGAADFTPQDGYLFLDRTKLRESFAANVSAEISPWGGGYSVSNCNLLKRNALSTVELSSFP